MFRIDEWLVIIDEVVFVVVSREGVVVFHEVMPVCRSNVGRVVIVFRNKVDATSIADAVSNGCLYVLGVVWFRDPIFPAVIKV